jgi:hypothetical protein
MLVGDILRNKCFLQDQISHALRFLSICDIFTESPSYFHTQYKICYILRQVVPLNQDLDSEQPDIEDIQRVEISGKKLKKKHCGKKAVTLVS